jgi:hypothetical protein
LGTISLRPRCWSQSDRAAQSASVLSVMLSL